jgi:replication factor C subunit 1
MFTTVYRPKHIEDFIGNRLLIQPFIKWLLEWDFNDKKNKCALVSGLCGIGKSLLVELILKKHDYNIINLDIDDDRDKNYINTFIKPLLYTKKTFDDQENILVVSDIDSGGDYGFISSLVECIKISKIPIIFICDNRYDQSIKSLLNYCYDIKLSKPNYSDIYKLIYNVVTKEKIRIKESQIKNLYEQSNGDIRFMLNSLQCGLFENNKNIQSSNIFETTGQLLLMDESFDNKYNKYWLSSDLHTLMIHENYINNTLSARDEVKRIENLSYSAECLSDADIFDSQLNMSNWEISPYVAVNTICATTKCNKKSMIKFPQYLGRISTQNKNKREKIDYEQVEFFEKPKINLTKQFKEKKEKQLKEKKEKPIKEKKETKNKKS